jgi:hypothetical protein
MQGNRMKQIRSELTANDLLSSATCRGKFMEYNRIKPAPKRLKRDQKMFFKFSDVWPEYAVRMEAISQSVLFYMEYGDNWGLI